MARGCLQWLLKSKLSNMGISRCQAIKHDITRPAPVLHWQRQHSKQHSLLHLVKTMVLAELSWEQRRL